MVASGLRAASCSAAGLTGEAVLKKDLVEVGSDGGSRPIRRWTAPMGRRAPTPGRVGPSGGVFVFLSAREQDAPEAKWPADLDPIIQVTRAYSTCRSSFAK